MTSPIGRALSGLVLLVVVGCASRAPVPSSPLPSPSTAARSSADASDAPPTIAPSPRPSVPIASTLWMVSAAAPMPVARDGFQALVLGDDTVLVAGDDSACMPGPASHGSETVDRYDPAADTWSAAPSLNKPRKEFAMVATPDGGALVIGGVNADGEPFSSTKRLDVRAAAWVDGPLLARAYAPASAVAVEDGRIYVVGPTILDETSTTSTVEILAPGRDAWDDGARIEGVMVRDVIRLDDGRLFALGSAFESPELIFVHDSGGAEGWSALASPALDFVERIVAIPGGVVAFGSNYDPSTGGTAPQSPMRHDPATDRWVATGPMAAPRTDAQITSLRDGRILVAGGVAGPRDVFDGRMVRTTEIYDPSTDGWSPGPALLGVRYGGQAITLRDGSVLLLGGTNVRNSGGDTPFCPEQLTSVERLTPSP